MTMTFGTRFVFSVLVLLSVACHRDRAGNRGARQSSGGDQRIDDVPADMPRPEPAPEEDLAALGSASTAFGADLYQALRSRPGNLAVSPVSLAIALDMTYAGARGATAGELERAMHLPFTGDRVHAAASTILARWDALPTRAVVVRNRLFVDRRFQLLPGFQTSVAQAYRAPAVPLALRDDAVGSASTINQWVREATRQRIPSIVTPENFDADSRLVLVNAIYFLANWASPFEEAVTRDEPFHLANGTTRTERFMHRQGSYQHATVGDVDLVAIGYERSSMMMVIALPHEGVPLARVEEGLDGNRVSAWTGSLRTREVNLALPKFKIETAAMPLGEPLRALGMSTAFSDRADFSGMSAEALKISEVVQRVFVEVNERGTEAAAATAVLIATAGAAPSEPEQPIRFTADRPFLFLIYDRATSSTLFMGRVVEPTR